MLFKRYILIFTLALISCAGTNYIHSMTTSELPEMEVEKEGLRATEVDSSASIGEVNSQMS